MSKALITVIGVGDGVENAIYTSLKTHNAEFIIFIASEKSRLTLDRIIEKENKSILDCYRNNEIFILTDVDNINPVFEVCEKALDYLKKKGYNEQDVAVDITSGTKIMSSAICSLAILHRLSNITYVTGKRDNNGRVRTGTEEVRMMNYASMFFRQDFIKIKEYLSDFQFDAALLIINKNLRNKNLNDNENSKLTDLKEIVEGFINWEHFDHNKSIKNFQRVEKYDVSAQINFLEELKRDVARETGKAKDIQKDHNIVPSQYIIIDIFENACRRIKMGQYDDATARLYRCIEMIGQYLLTTKFKILSSDIDIELIKNKISEEYFTRLERKRTNYKITTGAKENLELFSELDQTHPISILYKNKEDELKTILQYRNNSILAHGLNPVIFENAKKMKELVEEFVKKIDLVLFDRLTANITRCFTTDDILSKI